jgi:hypothetical protein
MARASCDGSSPSWTDLMRPGGFCFLCGTAHLGRPWRQRSGSIVEIGMMFRADLEVREEKILPAFVTPQCQVDGRVAREKVGIARACAWLRSTRPRS